MVAWPILCHCCVFFALPIFMSMSDCLFVTLACIMRLFWSIASLYLPTVLFSLLVQVDEMLGISLVNMA